MVPDGPNSIVCCSHPYLFKLLNSIGHLVIKLYCFLDQFSSFYSKCPRIYQILYEKILEIKDFQVIKSLKSRISRQKFDLHLITSLKSLKSRMLRFFLLIEEYRAIFFPPSPDNVKTLTQPKNQVYKAPGLGIINKILFI